MERIARPRRSWMVVEDDVGQLLALVVQQLQLKEFRAGRVRAQLDA